MTDKSWNLLAKYLAGESSKAEIIELKSWINTSAENEQVFFQMSQVYQSSLLNDANVDGAFRRLTHKLQDEKLI